MNFTVNGEQVDLLGEAIQISNLENLEQIQSGDQVTLTGIQDGDEVSELFFRFHQNVKKCFL